MSAQYKGSVGYIGEKVFGGKKFYSFTLKGTDGFFRLGTNKPSFKVGGYVEFTADEKLNVEGEVTSLAEREPEVSKPGMPPKSAVAGPGDRIAQLAPINYREEQEKIRQRSIHFQSASKTAVEVAKIMLERGNFKIPVTPAKSYDAILALVDELTDRYFHQYETQTTAELENKETAVAEDNEDSNNNE